MIIDCEGNYINSKLLLIDLQLYNTKTRPIMSGYRPDWISDNKPEYNCACVILLGRTLLLPNEKCCCLLMPLRVELWNDVKVGDILKMMEGPHEFGSARVIGIISEDKKEVK